MTHRQELLTAAENNDFFADFMSYLKYLEKQPIKLTATGNISMSKIVPLLNSFRQRQVFEDHEKYGWKIRYEYEIEFLEQIKITAEIMNVTYKRKGFIKLSKNGFAFIQNIDPLIQYLNMVLYYWGKVNWDYFTYSAENNGANAIDVLQKNQKIIWEVFSRQSHEWIDFKNYCNGLRQTFELEKFYLHPEYGDFSYYLDIEYGLFHKNLVRFGCVDIKEAKNENGIDMITQFRVTPLGELMFIKAQDTWI